MNAAACRCWPEREGRAHITLPRCLRKSTTPAADGTLPGRAHFPHRGFIEYSWAGADPRAKGQALLLHSGSDIADSGRLKNFPVGCQLAGARRKASNDLRAEQGLRGKDNNTTTLLEAGYDSTTFTLIIRTCGRNHPAPSDRSCCSWPSHAGRKEGNAGPPGSGKPLGESC